MIDNLLLKYLRSYGYRDKVFVKWVKFLSDAIKGKIKGLHRHKIYLLETETKLSLSALILKWSKLWALKISLLNFSEPILQSLQGGYLYSFGYGGILTYFLLLGR